LVGQGRVPVHRSRPQQSAYLLGTGPGFTVTGREQNHIVRAGINYHFNWFGGAPGPVVARY